MEGQVLVVVLKENLSAPEMQEIINRLREVEGVLIVKTFERIVEDALPIPAE
jgi:hypothetical protein